MWLISNNRSKVILVYTSKTVLLCIIKVFQMKYLKDPICIYRYKTTDITRNVSIRQTCPYFSTFVIKFSDKCSYQSDNRWLT